MPILTILPSGKSVEVAAGTSLLNAILQAGERLSHKCDAKADCGTCHVFVPVGKKTLSKAQRIENDRLDATIGVGSKSRLACQALVGQEDITVELLGFGSG